MTPAQVTALRHAPEVARAFKATKVKTTAIDPDTILGGGTSNPLIPDGASYLGLARSGGLWDKLGGYDAAGNGIVVGDIDTGITPQHPSFAATPAGAYVGSPYGPPPATWHGTCVPGIDASDGPPTDPAKTNPALQWTAATCNNKLIGARYYFAGFGQQHLAPDSFLSARDDDGHGSHTAATAAGNFGVDPSILGSNLGVDHISGIAPRARIAVYKICWVGGDVADGCSTADSVKAIDDAVADGVDVINYSVGSSTPTIIDAVVVRLPRSVGRRRLRLELGRQRRPGSRHRGRTGSRAMADHGRGGHARPDVRGDGDDHAVQRAGLHDPRCLGDAGAQHAGPAGGRGTCQGESRRAGHGRRALRAEHPRSGRGGGQGRARASAASTTASRSRASSTRPAASA